MPLVRGCRRRWCPNYADGPDGWCPAHRRPAFYGSAPMPRDWPKVRAAQLTRSPWCESCGQAATDVHHRTARAAGGTDDPANLVSLCGRCHHAVTGRECGAW